MRISDWSSDVCSSDLPGKPLQPGPRIAAADLRVERSSVSHRVDVEQPITNLIGDDPNDRSGQRIGNEGCARRDGHIGTATNRKCVVEGKSDAVRVVLGVRELLKNKTNVQQTSSGSIN